MDSPQTQEVPGGRPPGPILRWMILLVAGAYFLIPLWAALRFAGIRALGSVVTQAGFGDALWLSVRLAVVTTIITIALMLPTAVYVHLRLPAVRRLLEGITILPIVIPPVVLSVGVLEVAPGFARWTSRPSSRRPTRSARAGSPRCGGWCCRT